MMPAVLFLEVNDNKTKLKTIWEVIQKHYPAETLLIKVPNAEAAAYIDQLLWRYAEESFIPHAVVNGPSKERIVITTKNENLNQAQVLLNLCAEAASNAVHFKKIYELMDKTDRSKESASFSRIHAYKSMNIDVN